MRALVALGSNLGDRHAHLAAGLEGLRELGQVLPSPLEMETPDESGIGPAYLNTVAYLETSLEDPRALLEELFRRELRQGRDRGTGRNAPRTLDLDLIVVEGYEGHWTWPRPEGLSVPWVELNLQLPHPRARERAFVMEPWRVLAPDLPEALRP